MSYQRERDQFMVQVAGTLGIPTARALLRCATTLQRLAEAQCNGDWPADNGERKVVPCPLCESCWVPSQIQGGALAKEAHRLARLRAHLEALTLSAQGKEAKACPDCRTEGQARQLVAGSPYQIGTQGDPRGAVLSLYPREATRESIKNGSARRIYVPTR